MKCSVVILNWNGQKMLKQYLPSVVAYTQGDGIEVVVADNGSMDDSLHVLCDFPSVRVIKMDQNYGFAEGYNRALREVDSEYVVLLNSDVEVTPDWLTTLLDYMDTHPDVWACQPKIRSWKNRAYFEYAGAAGGRLDCLGYPYCYGRVLGNVEEDRGQYDAVTDIFWASGACLCIRKDAYQAAGGLDADFFAHMEEIDLCWRIWCRGGRIVSVPASTVYHLGGGALAYESPRKTYLNFRNNLLMLYKNLPAKRMFVVMSLRFVLDYTAGISLLFRGKPKNAWAVVQARWDFMRLRHTDNFINKRKENLQKAVIPYPDSISNGSILVDHYLRLA
ncbi:MAG: glycosyltransferase family 2 protein [Paludibacteraceae bacterium]|nr:glycosyltransferase family 2 protein [Paludibacteraceae bacterium]